MKIDYKILWLDDNIEAFITDKYVDEIKKYLSLEGFEPYIKTIDNPKEFFEELDNSYDLILTDYHMDGMNGDEVVKNVRTKNKIFTEILFYTAQSPLKDINKLDRISFLQTRGNHYKQVVKKIKELISLTIQKFHDIVVMRGMIMNETSDLDNQKIEILKTYINKSDNNTIQDLKCEILDEIESQFSGKLKKIQGEWKTKNNGFKNLIKDNFVFSSSYKIKTLGWILNQLSEEDFSKEYDDEIINIRNLFAHVVLQEDKDKNGIVIKKYFKKDDDEYDSEYCKKIRININKHKKNLNNLKNKING